MTDDGDAAGSIELSRDGIVARYRVEENERVLEFAFEGRTAVVAQNTDGYAMVRVRPAVDGEVLERYYGFEMALDHAAELLGVRPGRLPVPGAAEDMGI